MLRTNLGSGSPGPEGWTNINLLPGENIDYALDMRKGLPFADDEVAMAVCHHVLDLLDLAEMMTFLAEVKRVLVPGGQFRISIANQEAAASALARGDHAWFGPVDNGEMSLPDLYREYAFQRGARKQYLTRDVLVRLLYSARFVLSTGDHDPEICALDSRHNESVFVQVTA